MAELKKTMEYIIRINDNDIVDSDGNKRIEEMNELIRCRNCCHWKPPHIALNDGKQRLYIKGKEPSDLFGIGVTIDVGINIGGKCWLEQNCGYGRDMRVFRKADDYCSRAVKLPEGTTAEEYWGLSEEPAELSPDSD